MALPSLPTTVISPSDTLTCVCSSLTASQVPANLQRAERTNTTAWRGALGSPGAIIHGSLTANTGRPADLITGGLDQPLITAPRSECVLTVIYDRFRKALKAPL